MGGQNRVSMPELKRLYETLGLRNVVTYIQSGNVVFDCAEKEPGKIIRIIEDGITRSFGSEVRVILRDKESFKKILGSNPLINQRGKNPEKLYITFLSNKPLEADIKNLTAPLTNPQAIKPNPLSPKSLQSQDISEDEFIICDKEVYLYCPNGYGKTKFSNTFFEKKLKVSATTRNWKTVNALYELAERRRK